MNFSVDYVKRHKETTADLSHTQITKPPFFGCFKDLQSLSSFSFGPSWVWLDDLWCRICNLCSLPWIIDECWVGCLLLALLIHFPHFPCPDRSGLDFNSWYLSVSFWVLSMGGMRRRYKDRGQDWGEWGQNVCSACMACPCSYSWQLDLQGGFSSCLLLHLRLPSTALATCLPLHTVPSDLCPLWLAQGSPPSCMGVPLPSSHCEDTPFFIFSSDCFILPSASCRHPDWY